MLARFKCCVAGHLASRQHEDPGMFVTLPLCSLKLSAAGDHQWEMLNAYRARDCQGDCVRLSAKDADCTDLTNVHWLVLSVASRGYYCMIYR